MYFHSRSPFITATRRAVWRAIVDVPSAGDGALPWGFPCGVDRFRLVDHWRGIRLLLCSCRGSLGAAAWVTTCLASAGPTLVWTVGHS